MKKIPIASPAALIPLSLLLLASACGGGGEENPFGLESELVTVAERPGALAFAPDGRLFYAEQYTGNIRVVTADGELLEEPFAHIDVAVHVGWGITCLAFDPDFDTNHYIYVYFTALVDPETPTAEPMVMRFTDEDNRGVDSKAIVEDLPETNPERPGINGSGSIHFGPDGFLFITLGDYDYGKTIGPGGEPYALDLTTPVGKMLRVNKEDGSPAPGNPFVDEPDADPRIFAYGFLRSFDFAFHPETGRIYAHDNTVSCEELNVIEAGNSYGWPDVGEFPFADCFAGGQTPAIHLLAKEGVEPGVFLSAVQVNALEFVSGDVYPLIGDGLLVCEFETRFMRRLVLTGSDFDQVTADDVIVDDCALDIAVSPDGIVYYSDETEIRRLVPVEEQQAE